MRDRLIELVNEAKEQYFNDVTDHTETDYIVECLLDNGVIVPPCKVGQDIWHVTKDYDGRIEIRKGKVSMLQQKADKSWKIRITVKSSVWDFTPDEIGTRYFLTREEAEAKLKGGEG